MSAEIYLISKMEKDGRITSDQADELMKIAVDNEFYNSNGICLSGCKMVSY